jgi:(R,R)-butanediol dehydrogenase / meso-butanediol dehydrogenase / diacetyl reductase
MRAAVVGPGGRFEITSVPDPSPSPDELLIRVAACGLCGSDIKTAPIMPAGSIMGHEFSGEVIAVGTDVADWTAGSHVAVLPAASCGKCEWCASGYVIHCPSARMVGLGGIAGGFAELVSVPAATAFLIPPGVDPAFGPLVEPFAVGLHTADTASLASGDDVLVVGAGTVGLTTIAWARARGARRITAVDPAGIRRAAAQSFGATDVLASLAQAEAGGYSVVAECAGKPGLLDGCVAAARARGRVVMAGVALEPSSFSTVRALMKEVSIGFAVYYTPADYRAVLAAFASGKIDPAPLESRRVDLGRLNEAFDDLARTATSAKTLIEP